MLNLDLVKSSRMDLDIFPGRRKEGSDDDEYDDDDYDNDDDDDDDNSSLIVPLLIKVKIVPFSTIKFFSSFFSP